MSSTVALNKNAFPTRQHDRRRTFVQISPVVLRKSSSAKSGFRSLCGHEQRSFYKAIALNFTRVLEPFTRCGSRFRDPGFDPLLSGSGTGVVAGT
jgi:hypothetical protein